MDTVAMVLLCLIGDNKIKTKLNNSFYVKID
jgi:hypothetical protein